MRMKHAFEVIREIENVKTIAVGGRIRDIMRLRKQYGPGRWRKLKGIKLPGKAQEALSSRS